MHTGADVTGSGSAYTVAVRAAADGWLEKRVPYTSSRGLGNTVILRHANGRYSLYGHLDSFNLNLSIGQFVIQGTQLGIMGNSADVPRDTFGIHVHFEIKDNPTLGNISDSAGVGYVGYTPGHPDLYAYHDPRLIIAGIAVQTISPIVLRNPPPGQLNVRGSPGTTYHGSTATPVIGQLGEGHKAVARRRANVSGVNWYLVDLPSRNAPLEGSPHPNNGIHAGWIAGSVALEDSSATQLRVLASEYNVRTGAGTGNSLLAKVYAGQRFVMAGASASGVGCTKPWYPMFVAGNSSVSPATGWICGDGIEVLSGSDSTPPTISITSPTSGSTFTTSSSPINLGGTAADGVGVTQVTWANDRGGSGSASGTTSWTIGGIALQNGTNVITVTARDAANNTGTDTLTVTYNPPVVMYTLTVSGAGTGTGTVSGSGINCTIASGSASGTCSASFPSGANVSLSAGGTGGSTFSGWSGACSGTSGCNLTMNANKSVTAAFTRRPIRFH
jgi:murein DD-endopeptidase MepM/ murein hydrolase activator NlpD